MIRNSVTQNGHYAVTAGSKIKNWGPARHQEPYETWTTSKISVFLMPGDDCTVPFHGEHDAQEPTKVKRGQGGVAQALSLPNSNDTRLLTAD